MTQEFRKGNVFFILRAPDSLFLMDIWHHSNPLYLDSWKAWEFTLTQKWIFPWVETGTYPVLLSSVSTRNNRSEISYSTPHRPQSGPALNWISTGFPPTCKDMLFKLFIN